MRKEQELRDCQKGDVVQLPQLTNGTSPEGTSYLVRVGEVTGVYEEVVFVRMPGNKTSWDYPPDTKVTLLERNSQ